MRRSVTVLTAAPFLVATAPLPVAGLKCDLAPGAALAAAAATSFTVAGGLSAALGGADLWDAAGADVRAAAECLTGAAARLTAATRVFFAGAACAALLCLVLEACFDLRVVGIAVPIYIVVRTICS